MARLISPNNIWSWMLLLSQTELLQCSSTVYYIQKLPKTQLLQLQINKPITNRSHGRK